MLGQMACQLEFCDTWVGTGYKGKPSKKHSNDKLLIMAKNRYVSQVKNKHLGEKWRYLAHYYYYGEEEEIPFRPSSGMAVIM